MSQNEMIHEIPVTYLCWGCGSSVSVIEETEYNVPSLTKWNICPECIKRKENKMQAYCVKCRKKREMKNAKAITMKNGRKASQGTCPVCGMKMFRIGG